jgi:hypothetical protein
MMRCIRCLPGFVGIWVGQVSGRSGASVRFAHFVRMARAAAKSDHFSPQRRTATLGPVNQTHGTLAERHDVPTFRLEADEIVE